MPSPLSAETDDDRDPGQGGRRQQAPHLVQAGSNAVGRSAPGGRAWSGPRRRRRYPGRRAARGARWSGPSGRRRQATTSIAASISPAPTSMLPTSRSCPGTSTKSSSARASSCAGQTHVRVADVDGHAAPPLLGQAVGVDAGQRAEQSGLAVVDVAGGADDDGHAGSWYGPGCAACPPSARAMAPGSVSSQLGSIVRRSSTTASSSMRATIAGEPTRSRRASPAASDRAARGPTTGASRRAVSRRRWSPRAGTHDRRVTEPGQLAGQRLGRSTGAASSGAAIMRQTGISVVGQPGTVEPQRRRHRRPASPCRDAWRGPGDPCGCWR